MGRLRIPDISIGKPRNSFLTNSLITKFELPTFREGSIIKTPKRLRHCGLKLEVSVDVAARNGASLLASFHGGGAGRCAGVGRDLGAGLGLGVGVGLGLTVAVAVAVGVAVAVAVGVGVGVGPSGYGGLATRAMVPEPSPGLKKSSVAELSIGAASASNEKLYSVPHRIALAFGFWSKVSVLQFAETESRVKVQGVLLYPASPTVPSCAHRGC